MTNDEFLKRIKLISDETRLKIIQYLSDNGTKCACKILEELNITQGTLSHHMKALCLENITSCKKEGKWCYYTLNKEAICDLTYFLMDICKTKENDEKCCCCGEK